jgi:small ligand-binding sensory domain FIST
VRDRQGAQEDLKSHGLAFKRRQLAALIEGGDAPLPPFGMLLFSCNGRGSGLYGEPDWDSRAISQYVPVPAVSGFLANGEIGKVAGSSRLHGFTCVVGVLRLAAAGSGGSVAEGTATEAVRDKEEGAGQQRQEP